VGCSGNRRARIGTKRTLSDVPGAKRRTVRSLHGPTAETEEVGKKCSSSPALLAFVRALARKAAREWLRNQSGDQP
jgi:hypothetical protein